MTHGIPFSIFLGRVVEEGEPAWLPDDRDIVDAYLAEDRVRLSCGHWESDVPDFEGLEPGYKVCKLCAEMGPYEVRIREQNHARQEDEHGLTFGWFPPRGEDDGD